MTSKEIRDLKKELEIIKNLIKNQNNRSCIDYPIKVLIYSLLDTLIDLSFLSLLLYLTIYYEFWIFSFILGIVIIFRNIGGLMLNINVSLIMTIIGIFLLTYSYNAYPHPTSQYDFDFEFNYSDENMFRFGCTDYNQSIEMEHFKNNMTSISDKYTSFIINSSYYKNTVEFKEAFFNNFEDLKELLVTINTTVIYINETLNYIQKSSPSELGKSMGTYFQEKTNDIKNIYQRVKTWNTFLDYISQKLDTENKIK